MGIVIKQSLQNTLITYIGFGIGALNTILLYPHILGEEYFGLTNFVLASANVLMPLMAFGIQNTLVRYFLHYKTEKEKDQFLSMMLLLPLVFAIPFLVLTYIFYPQIAGYFSTENPEIYNFFWEIPIIGLFMAYFEIFYAWAKVHMQSTFGNLVKEVILRVFISFSLCAVFLKWISLAQFIQVALVIYFLMALLMMLYAIRLRPIRLSLQFPEKAKTIIGYSIFIILSGSIANVLLDLDRMMLGKYLDIKNVAYYSVAVFIANVVIVPSRAMHQITYPITTKLMHESKWAELNELYKKTSITLQVLGGLIFVGILVNINELFLILPHNYSAGLFTVFVIGASKYFDLILGNNNAIIFNSPYYRVVLILGVLLAFVMVGLNMWLIPLYQINGSAFATLVSMFLYSLAKLLFVTMKLKLFPFTIRNLYSFIILLVTFFLFYFWEFPFHHLINIVLKSILVSVFYVGAHYFLKISSDINTLIQGVLKLILPKSSL